MNNNAYEQYLESGLTLQEFADSKSSEWELPAETIIEDIKQDMKRYRVPQYPDIGDQLDALWHAIDEDKLDKTSEFYTMIKTVKDANPKP